MAKKYYDPKPEFIQRMKSILKDEKDIEDYFDIIQTDPSRSIRCNTLKISPSVLKSRLEKNYNWKLSCPFKDYPEIMIVDSLLLPGELGRSLEHLLGYYYVQELASMLPSIVLSPKSGEKILDLCASPGSKTTQIASMMNNEGLIVANEVSMGRLTILTANTSRCGVSNVIVTKKDGVLLCRNLSERMTDFKFDKILVDAPCSGEGTIRSTPITNKIWNPRTILTLSKVQKHLIESAISVLKIGGELVYSTCTHAPEENEEVLNYILTESRWKDKVEIVDIKKSLPKELKTRPGLNKWQDKTYNPKITSVCRFYPQDNNTEGFFISKLKKIKD